MKRNILIGAALLFGAALSSSAATDLRFQKDSSGGSDLLDVSQWGYFWHLQDSAGDTRPSGTGNAWAGVPGDANTTKDSEGSVFQALTTEGNTDYNLRLENLTSVSFSLSEAVYFNAVDVSGSTLTSWTIDFGTQGSLTTAEQIDFGSSVETITFTADLSEADIATVLTGGTASRTLLEGKSNYGIWNLSDHGTKNFSSSALDTAGLTNVGYVTSMDAIAEGQYGFLYLANGGDHSLQLVAKGLIPEPTTATLSLLALAGLAARRRRK